MLIYVNKKKMFYIGRTDGRSTQNYSSEPHKMVIDYAYLVIDYI